VTRPERVEFLINVAALQENAKYIIHLTAAELHQITEYIHHLERKIDTNE
jgi:hypothetical protein